MKRCSYTGDYLCDTPADPNLGRERNNGVLNDARNVSGNCNQYIQAARVVDYRGDVYTPLLDNYMRYGQNECINTFTKGQVGVMWWVLKNMPRGRSGRWRMDLTGRQADIYEPNNTISGATNIVGQFFDGRQSIGRFWGNAGNDNNELRLAIPQTHTFHKNIYGEMIDQQDWIPIDSMVNGVLEDLVITVESDIPNFIEDIEVFTAGNPNGVSVEFPLLTRIVSSSIPNQTRWQISIPCAIVNDPSRLFLRVRRNQNLNEFGTYTVLAQSSNNDIEISVDGEPTTICAGTTYTARLENFTLTPNISIVWQDSVAFDNGTSLPLSEIVAARNQATAPFSTTQTSGIYILRATITNNLTGCRETIEREFRIGLIPVANIEIETPVGINVQNLCPSMPLFLLGNLIEINGIDWEQVEEIEWTTSNPNFQLIPTPSTENRRVTVIPSSIPNDSTFIAFRVRNACGWSEQVIQLRNGKRDSQTCIGEPDAGFQVYPNPTGGFIDIDILCLCGIDPEDPINPNPDPQKYSISRVDISDMFGTTRLSYQGGQIPVNPDGKIRLNLSSLPAANYILKLIMQDKVYMKHVIKQ